MPKTIGPREQQLRDMRTHNYGRTLGTGPTMRPTNPHPEIRKLATTQQETTMATKKASKKTTKTPRKAKGKAKAKIAAKRPRPAARKPASAAPKTDKAVRSGSKLETVAGLLKRSEGCTRDDILTATGWKAVNVPRIAAQAGIAITKTKEAGSPSRYMPA